MKHETYDNCCKITKISPTYEMVGYKVAQSCIDDWVKIYKSWRKYIAGARWFAIKHKKMLVLLLKGPFVRCNKDPGGVRKGSKNLFLRNPSVKGVPPPPRLRNNFPHEKPTTLSMPEFKTFSAEKIWGKFSFEVWYHDKIIQIYNILNIK